MKTIKDIIAELEKFEDKSAPLTIIASTNREDPESGENFIDGAVVQRVSVNALDGRMDIKVSDEGTWTVSDALTVLRKAGKPESVARVKIGYGAHPMTDSEGEPVSIRLVEDCTVLEEDAIWNVTLGEVVKTESEG